MTCALLTARELEELNRLSRESGCHCSSAYDQSLVNAIHKLTGRRPKVDDDDLHLVVASAEHLKPARLTHHLKTLANVSANPIDRLSTCLWLMECMDSQAAEEALWQAGHADGILPSSLTRRDVQRVIDDVLLAYPVLMDNRILFSVREDGLFDEVSELSVAAALANSAHAALPSPTNGHSALAIAEFATHPCTRAGLLRTTPRTPTSSSGLHGCLPMGIAPTDRSLSDWPRDEFLEAAISLSAAAIAAGQEPLIDPGWECNANQRFAFPHFARVFWSLALGQAGESPLAGPAFLRIASLPALVPPSAGPAISSMHKGDPRSLSSIHDAIALAVDTKLFGWADAGMMSSRAVTVLPDDLTANTLRTIDCLVTTGLCSDRAAAAAWLRDSAIGIPRVRLAMPPCPPAGGHLADAFIGALLLADPDMDFSSTTALDIAQAAVPTAYVECWRTSLSAVRVQRAMQRTIQGVAPERAPESARRSSL